MQLKQQVLLPVASTSCPGATCPVHELTSLRDVQSVSRPVHELAIRELPSYRYNLHTAIISK